MSNKRIFIRYLSFTALLGLMVLVFAMSSQNANESSGTSGGFIRMIAPFIKPSFHSLSVVEQEDFVSSLQFIVRKGAHFSVYALMGMFCTTGMFTYEKIKTIVSVSVAFAICVLFSITDEIHQSFVPGRSCEFRDILIDSSGVLLGCFLVLGVYLLIKRRACRN